MDWNIVGPTEADIHECYCMCGCKERAVDYICVDCQHGDHADEIGPMEERCTRCGLVFPEWIDHCPNCDEDDSGPRQDFERWVYSH